MGEERQGQQTGGLAQPLGHASAIRPGELFDAIQRIAIGKETTDATLVENAKSLLIALGYNKDTLNNTAKTLADVGRTVTTLTDSAKNSLELVTDQSVRHKIENAVTAAVDAATGQLKTAATAAAIAGVSVALQDIANRFDRCADRIS